MAISKMTYNDWFELADQYYLSARTLQWFSGVSYPAAFTAHHSLELYFKAISVKETGQYPIGHELKDLHKHLVEIDLNYNLPEIDTAVKKLWNYDQSGRYSSSESKLKPENNSMGSDSLRSLDLAVSKLRDLSVETRGGIDRLIAGETDVTKVGFRDPHLSLNSVILFYMNDAFKPKNPEVLKQVRFSAPQWPITESERENLKKLEEMARLNSANQI